MVKRSFEAKRNDEDEVTDGAAILPRNVISIRKTLDELGVARCPICRAVLVARQGRAGPYYSCSCEMKRAS